MFFAIILSVNLYAIPPGNETLSVSVTKNGRAATVYGQNEAVLQKDHAFLQGQNAISGRNTLAEGDMPYYKTLSGVK
ncbi:hypothetical protein [Taibaiella koreensis]|uniref:hypothetical protein n=1 Tax=Taibaiella koreensis TaxID=1268548 RepID=UPI0013C34EDF|nr:hypothetical protein [Taibaiella koreensis]